MLVVFARPSHAQLNIINLRQGTNVIASNFTPPVTAGANGAPFLLGFPAGSTAFTLEIVASNQSGGLTPTIFLQNIGYNYVNTNVQTGGSITTCASWPAGAFLANVVVNNITAGLGAPAAWYLVCPVPPSNVEQFFISANPTTAVDIFVNVVNTGNTSFTGTVSALSTVIGPTASGATSTQNPIQIAAQSGFNVTALKADSFGSLTNAGNTTGNDNVSNVGIAAPICETGTCNFSGTGGFKFNGVTWDRDFYCNNSNAFSVTSTTTQVVAASGSTKIRICSFDINPSTVTAGSTDIVYGTGVNCATGLTTLTGAYTLPAAAVVDITPSTLGPGAALITPASQAVCVRAVTSTVNGFVVWAQF